MNQIFEAAKTTVLGSDLLLTFSVILLFIEILLLLFIIILFFLQLLSKSNEQKTFTNILKNILWIMISLIFVYILTTFILVIPNQWKGLIIILIVMIMAGAWGGYINYLRKDRRLINFLTGLGASFLVPIFLNTLNSKLLINIANILNTNNNNNSDDFGSKIVDIFIFFGFCLLASISAQTFINSLGSKVLLSKMEEYSQEVKQVTKDAIKGERERNLKVARALLLMGEPQAINEALTTSEKVLQEDESNIQAILLQAIALSKRREKGDLDKALELVNEAIKNNKFDSNHEKYNYYKARAFYNRACFRNLLKINNQEIIYSDLEQAFDLLPELAIYANDKDEDLKNLRDQDWFKNLCNKYQQASVQ